MSNPSNPRHPDDKSKAGQQHGGQHDESRHSQHSGQSHQGGGQHGSQDHQRGGQQGGHSSDKPKQGEHKR
jgi:hypothetical protein